MTEPAPMPLDVHGSLALAPGGGPAATLAACGRRLVLDLPDLRGAARFRRALGARRARVARAAQGAAILARLDLDLEVRLRSHLVATLSARSRATWLGSLLGLGPVELRLRDLARALRPSARGRTP